MGLFFLLLCDSILIDMYLSLSRLSLRGRVMFEGDSSSMREFPSAPVLGVLPAVRRNGLETVFSEAAVYGSPCRIRIGPAPIVLVSDANSFVRVLRDNEGNYVKPRLMYEPARRIAGRENLVVSSGDFWREQRRMIGPYFHRQAVVQMAAQMIEIIGTGLERWDDFANTGQVMDLQKELAFLTLRVIFGTMLGEGIVTGEDYTNIQESADYIITHTENLSNFALAFYPWLPMPGRREFGHQISNLRSRISGLVQIVDAMTVRQGKIDKDNLSLIEMLLLSVVDEMNERMDHGQLINEAVTIFLAGYETSSTLVTWLLGHDLVGVRRSADPNLRVAYSDLMDEAFVCPSPKDIFEMAVIPEFINESLRLHPPAPMLARGALADDVLNGVPISQGSNILLYFYGLHRNPDYWNRPNEFDPRRFRDGIVPQSFLPFSFGMRKCLGADFAMVEMQILTSMILARYDLNVVGGDGRPKLGGVLRPTEKFEVIISSKK